jgi:hypothetical protein
MIAIAKHIGMANTEQMVHEHTVNIAVITIRSGEKGLTNLGHELIAALHQSARRSVATSAQH